ncbi:MAG: TIGR00266 family protein [Tissierellia bacterium]|nr:TIGR00266 family protein [Tissierellia bacterium]
MKYSIEGGALPVVRIYLEPGESIISEAGGRTWARGNILTESTSEGGAKKALGRMFSGESLFLSKYTAQEPAEIAFASSFPGKILAVELGEGRSIIAQRKSFMCGTYGVQMSAHVQKKLGAGLAGGEGFIMQKITGPGIIFLEIDGYCVEYDLQPGERMVLDTGVLAAMEETVNMEVEMVKGMKNVLLGGEGLFDTYVTGPGKVYLQTMTIENLAKLMIPFIPAKG